LKISCRIIKIKKGVPDSLKGSFYIIFTGETDKVSGLPIAEYPNGSQCEEDESDCVVGWKIKAKPGAAKFLYHSGVNGNDHPVWMVDRVDIPQPGSYTHFHWITSTSSDPRGDENIVCPGWFLEIKVGKKKFAFQHGNEVVPVHRGIDNTTHLNLVTNYKADLEIDATRP
jgi:hypothetical protein